MKIEQTRWDGAEWSPAAPGTLTSPPQLVLIFGSPASLHAPGPLETIRRAYPSAQLFGCSTAGEICGTRVHDESLVATAVHFEATSIAVSYSRLSAPGSSFACGQDLCKSLDRRGLKHAFVLSDGLNVNGSELVGGIKSSLDPEVTVTGGLSADGARFKETFVLRDGVPESGVVALLGFYGDNVRVGYGSLGGWDPFGPERLITRSNGNVLYELDGQSALMLYKRYLGEHAAALPASGLLFPLALRTRDGDPAVVRTILAVDEAEQSMTFAGDVPEGAFARLMKANFDRLIDGATGAAKIARNGGGDTEAELALLISCVGRKLVLRQRIEEEVEGVRDALGASPTLAGFYSYGEISPFTPSARCELHNQTMTITTLSEVP